MAPDDMVTAYAVQQANVDRHAATGEPIVDRKVGLTSVAAQKQPCVDRPDFGTFFAGMVVGNGEPVALPALIQPKAETGIALVLERDLTHDRHTRADILHASAFAMASIEVVDSRNLVKPPLIMMRDTMYMFPEKVDTAKVKASILEMEKAVNACMPGYRLEQKVQFKDRLAYG